MGFSSVLRCYWRASGLGSPEGYYLGWAEEETVGLMAGPWKRYYCLVPNHLRERVLSEGLRPRVVSGGEVLQIYPSRKQVERYLKRGGKFALFQVDASYLKDQFLTRVDYDHIFYKAAIPSDAVKYIRGPFPNGPKPSSKKRFRL